MKKKKGKTVNTDGGVKKDDEEQSRRFVETAKEVEAEKSSKDFKKIMKSLKSK